jgi:hypothetical protein
MQITTKWSITKIGLKHFKIGSDGNIYRDSFIGDNGRTYSRRLIKKQPNNRWKLFDVDEQKYTWWTYNQLCLVRDLIPENEREVIQKETNEMISEVKKTFKEIELLLSERDNILSSNSSLKDQTAIANKLKKEFADLAILSVKMSRFNYLKNR